MRGLAVIAAVARNGVIGREGDLPWRLPDDLKHFKATTIGHCLVMGRRTWDSLPGPLPGRTSIVVSRDAGLRVDGAEVVGSLEAAIARAAKRGDEEPIVAGGASLYALALPMATRVWLTSVHADVEGDVSFPAWSRDGWQQVEAREHPADERHAHAFCIEHWSRE